MIPFSQLEINGALERRIIFFSLDCYFRMYKACLCPLPMRVLQPSWEVVLAGAIILFFSFCWSIINTQCYFSVRCTTYWLNNSVHYSALTMASVVTVCHHTTLLRYLGQLFLYYRWKARGWEVKLIVRSHIANIGGTEVNSWLEKGLHSVVLEQIGEECPRPSSILKVTICSVMPGICRFSQDMCPLPGHSF